MTVYKLNSLDKWIAKLGKNANQVVRAAALQVTTSVIERTRVDTGRARGNWHADLNAMTIKVENDYTGNPSAATQHALSKCSKAINQAYGNRLLITNNVPYISFLESKDAMVRLTIIEFNRAVAAACKSVS